MFSANSSQVSEDRLYVEDVFSTYLYTGNGSTQTITNGIDLAGKGGLVWMKDRVATWSHWLFDTARGQNGLNTNTTSAQTSTAFFQSFNSNGFTLNGPSQHNVSGDATASWTFREAPKFFDVVTYTGNGSTARAISHSLGVAPGSMIIKRTDSTGQWVVYHRSLGNANALVLESTSAQFSTNTFGYTTPDATTFTVGDYNNINGATYVAYLFAHDTSSTGIIQCGSYTGNGSATGPTVTLGWEPQWLLVKDATSAWDWRIVDNMRGMPVGSGAASLFPNLSNAEFTTSTVAFSPTATGFQVAGSAAQINTSGNTYIYIAIRRGPMRTPTSGTSVFSPVVRTGTGAAATVSTGNVPDWVIIKNRSGSDGNNYSRLTGPNRNLYTNLTLQEIDQGAGYGVTGFLNSSFTLGSDANGENPLGQSTVNYSFTRAPSFFDVVCYTGTGVARTVNHNLGVAPELMIFKARSDVSGWPTYAAPLGNQAGLNLHLDSAVNPNTPNWNYTTPTSSVFSVGSSGPNISGYTYVGYLFASCPGVSKIGTYTGNGSSQTINCGFAAGARFILIKRTDSAGGWVTFDSARGIVSGSDPSLLLNSTAAEVSADDIDPDSSGFIVNQSTRDLNASGGTYIYLAVA